MSAVPRQVWRLALRGEAGAALDRARELRGAEGDRYCVAAWVLARIADPSPCSVCGDPDDHGCVPHSVAVGPVRALVSLFKPNGKWYTDEHWRIPKGAVGPWSMADSPDFHRIACGPVLVDAQEPWGFPHLIPASGGAR